MKHRTFRNQLGLAVLAASFSVIPFTTVNAQPDIDIEEVVVTGSFIKGTPEDAALPVDVIGREDLEESGSPSMIEMVRNLGVTSGNLGETNQFQTGGQANEGVTTANLRGLGSARTLVLLNSKRHVATEAIGVDISAVPSIAIGRVEVLKDGAAALYGSDAIGGVVNFITRENVDGLEFRVSHQDIQDSDGDQTIGAIYGFGSDRYQITLSAEYERRNELQIKDRSWALASFAENPQAGFSSIGNPGRILPVFPGVGALSAGDPDPQCALLGGTPNPPSCMFQYTFFDNLIEETDSVRLFGEYNWDVSDNMTLHVEALWSEVDIPEWKTSPSYPPQSLTGPDRFIAANHPGLVDLKAQNPGLFIDRFGIPAAAQGAFVIGRMLGVEGRNGQPASSFRNTETKRFAVALDGLFDNGMSYDISASWSERVREVGSIDMHIERMALALDGLGGPNCDAAANIATPGTNGCEYYNPFSNAIQFSAVSGATNPQYNPAVANSDELIEWLTGRSASTATNTLFVLDAVFSGETEIELGGGNLGWAAGVQTRTESYDFELEDLTNRAINPCPFNDPVSVTLGNTATLDCSSNPSGRLAFLAATDEQSTDRGVYGAFLELALPLSDTLDMQMAFRYEDYGNQVGSTFDPKIALSWDATENLRLRGSASTTFRGPSQSFLSGTSTSLQFIAPASAFKAVDTTGNPNLKPENAVAVNLGAIYTTDNFYGSLDYWSFDFDDPFQTESAAQILTAYFGQGCEDGGAGVGTASCDALRAHVFPLGATGAQLERVQTNIINGSNIKTSGVDFNINYTFNNVLNGDLTVGGEGTYMLEYESDDFQDISGLTLAPGGDFVGKLNDGDPFTPIPELKGNVYLRWSADAHRVNYTMRYVDSYKDVRPALPSLATIDSHVTHDLHYLNDSFENVTISLSLVNLTDEEPPAASTDLAYDAFTHNAFGRMIKLGLTYRPEL